MIRIGVDAMGGDFFPAAPVQGALDARRSAPADIEIHLIGNQEVIQAELERQGAPADSFPIVHTEQYIEMGESATRAMLAKPDNTISLGVKLVKEGVLDAFASAGHTGAMLACAVIGLGVLDGVIRPTVGALYPWKDRYSLICDVGANLDAKPETLTQFGLVGSIYMRTMFGIENPRVALLNVGEEPGKGNTAAKKAYDLMAEDKRLNFVGNAEGWDMYQGRADVYVCDGFVGNIILKYSESLYDQFGPLLPGHHAIEHMNYERVGGLPFMGVAGNVMVGHGKSGPLAFENMVLRCADLVRQQLTDRLAEALAQEPERDVI